MQSVLNYFLRFVLASGSSLSISLAAHTLPTFLPLYMFAACESLHSRKSLHLEKDGVIGKVGSEVVCVWPSLCFLWFSETGNISARGPGHMARLQCRSVHQKVEGLIPDQGTYGGFALDPLSGSLLEAADQCFSLTLMLLSLSPFLSL